MRSKDYRRSARMKMQGNTSTLVVAYLLYSLIVAVLSLTGIGGIAVSIFSGAFLVGIAGMFLNNSRGETPKIEDIFGGFKTELGRNIVAGLLVYIFTALWTLLFIIPGIIKSYAYSMTFFICKDNPDMDASDAIAASKEMMKGHKWELFCLNFSFIGWYILCILTLGILSFWVGPFVQAANAEFYENLKNKN